MRAVILLLATASLFGGSKGSIDWKNASYAVWKSARDAGKPLLVELWGDWCMPCRRMDEEVWTKSEVIEATRKFVCVSIKVPSTGIRDDQEADLGLRGYRINAYPTVIVFDPWREVITIDIGYTYAKELLAQLKEIPADFNEIRNVRAALDSDRDNSRALRTVGAFYEKTTGFGIANRYYREALKKSGAKEDPVLREGVSFDIAQNELRRSDWKAAGAAFEHFRKEFPDAREDEVILGLVLSEVRRQDLPAAARHLRELETRFPESKAVPVAQGLLARAGQRAQR